MEAVREAAVGAADAGRSADEAVAALEPGLLAQHPDWAQPEWVGFAIRCFHAQPRPG
jgi:hypothetical protein